MPMPMGLSIVPAASRDQCLLGNWGSMFRRIYIATQVSSALRAFFTQRSYFMSNTTDSNVSLSNSLLATIMADESFRPSEPSSSADIGLPVSLIESLVLKRLANVGVSSGRQLLSLIHI